MSAKSVCDMSCGAMHEFALVLDKAGFDADLVQKIVNSRGNKQAKAMYAALTGGAQVDDRFELVGTFDVVVPEGYDHATRLNTFGNEHREEFYYYNENITDENYSKVTTKLVAGRKFKVKVFQIKETVTSDDCMAHLRSQKAVLVGAQGASLAYEQGKDKLPVNRGSVSFDEKAARALLLGRWLRVRPWLLRACLARRHCLPLLLRRRVVLGCSGTQNVLRILDPLSPCFTARVLFLSI